MQVSSWRQSSPLRNNTQNAFAKLPFVRHGKRASEISKCMEGCVRAAKSIYTRLVEAHTNEDQEAPPPPPSLPPTAVKSSAALSSSTVSAENVAMDLFSSWLTEKEAIPPQSSRVPSRLSIDWLSIFNTYEALADSFCSSLSNTKTEQASPSVRNYGTEALQFWKAHGHQLHPLNSVAAAILSKMSTSAPSERVFSKMPIICNGRRIQLRADKVCARTWLACNAHRLK